MRNTFCSTIIFFSPNNHSTTFALGKINDSKNSFEFSIVSTYVIEMIFKDDVCKYEKKASIGDRCSWSMFVVFLFLFANNNVNLVFKINVQVCGEKEENLLANSSSS